jgi:hypothetical protein
MQNTSSSPTLVRRVAHRWPALLGAAVVSVLVPGAVMAAGSFGPTVFTSGLGATAVTANGFIGIDASGMISALIAHTEGGEAIRAETANGGQAIVARSERGTTIRADGDAQVIAARSTGGHAIDARSEASTGIAAEAGNLKGLRPIGGPGVGVAASGEHFGVFAVGGDGGIAAEGLRGGIVTTGKGPGAPGITAFGGDAGSGVLASAKGDFSMGVVAEGGFAGVQATGGDTGVTGSGGEYGASFSGNKAPLRLRAASTQGAPKSALHRQGELYIDNQGHLFLCLADGTPGTWKEVVLK